MTRAIPATDDLLTLIQACLHNSENLLADARLLLDVNFPGESGVQTLRGGSSHWSRRTTRGPDLSPTLALSAVDRSGLP
jgi:hypothetical protein